jgi:hypothetical protein
MSDLRTRDGGALALALNEIERTYERPASIIRKAKSLHKWGYNASSANGTFETVQDGGGTETLLETNAITVIDSTSASDTAKTVRIEGHYLTADDDLVFVVQSAALTGTTAVTLSTPLARCSRMFISSGADAVGTITVNAGEGGTTYNQIVAGSSTSEKAATSISYRDYLIVTGFGASILGNNSAAVRFRADLKIPGQPWRPQARWSLKGDTTDYDQDTSATPFIIPPNSDIRIQASASSAGTSITAHFDGWFAIDTARANETPPAAA